MNICIFIPCYNASKTVLETLVAIEKNIFLYDKKIKVIAVDDCSKDNTYQILSNFKPSLFEIEIYRNEFNLGERATINKYFRDLELKYNWILLIHADDIPKENWILKLTEVISKVDQSNVFTVWSSYDNLVHETKQIFEGDKSGVINYNKRTFADATNYITKMSASYHVSGAAINLKLYFKIGGFNSDLPQFGDTVFFAEGILKGYNDVYIQDTLTYYRIIKSSVSFVSNNSNRDIKEMYYIYEKYFNILNTSQREIIIKRARIILIKRIIKNLIQFNLKSIGLLFFLLFKSFSFKNIK